MRPDEQQALTRRLAREAENARVGAQKRQEAKEREDARVAAERKQRQEQERRDQEADRRRRKEGQENSAQTEKKRRDSQYEFWRRQQAQSSEVFGTARAPVEPQTHFGSPVKAKSGGAFSKLLVSGILAFLAYVLFNHSHASPSGPTQNRPPEVQRDASSQSPVSQETIAKPTPVTPENATAPVPNAESGQEPVTGPPQATPSQPEPPVQPSIAPPGQTESAFPAPAPVTLRVVSQVAPVYPEFAKQAHISGQVTVRVYVAPNGRVAHTIVLSGNPILARAATDALRRWSYQAFTLAPGQLLPSTLVTFNFNR
jgi:TonB family protein